MYVRIRSHPRVFGSFASKQLLVRAGQGRAGQGRTGLTRHTGALNAMKKSYISCRKVIELMISCRVLSSQILLQFVDTDVL